MSTTEHFKFDSSFIREISRDLGMSQDDIKIVLSTLAIHPNDLPDDVRVKRAKVIDAVLMITIPLQREIIPTLIRLSEYTDIPTSSLVITVNPVNMLPMELDTFIKNTIMKYPYEWNTVKLLDMLRPIIDHQLIVNNERMSIVGYEVSGTLQLPDHPNTPIMDITQELIISMSKVSNATATVTVAQSSAGSSAGISAGSSAGISAGVTENIRTVSYQWTPHRVNVGYNQEYLKNVVDMLVKLYTVPYQCKVSDSKSSGDATTIQSDVKTDETGNGESRTQFEVKTDDPPTANRNMWVIISMSILVLIIVIMGVLLIRKSIK